MQDKIRGITETIKRAVERFNHYRYPEAKAEIIQISEDIAVIKFTGSFCMSCGVYDYFEDLIWISDLDAEILGYESAEEGFVVRYLLRKDDTNHNESSNAK